MQDNNIKRWAKVLFRTKLFQKTASNETQFGAKKLIYTQKSSLCVDHYLCPSSIKMKIPFQWPFPKHPSFTLPKKGHVPKNDLLV